jgi:hypothetical protein
MLVFDKHPRDWPRARRRPFRPEKNRKSDADLELGSDALFTHEEKRGNNSRLVFYCVYDEVENGVVL